MPRTSTERLFETAAADAETDTAARLRSPRKAPGRRS
jgi:hypothetical protein